MRHRWIYITQSTLPLPTPHWRCMTCGQFDLKGSTEPDPDGCPEKENKDG